MSFKSTLLVNAAMAGIFATGTLAQTPAPEAKSDKVRCGTINSCKGSGACKSSQNQCKGANACKGQGWVLTTSKECSQKGGTILPQM